MTIELERHTVAYALLVNQHTDLGSRMQRGLVVLPSGYSPDRQPAHHAGFAKHLGFTADREPLQKLATC